MNQEQVDKAWTLTKDEWNRLVNESGKSEALFAISKDGVRFLSAFEDIISEVRSIGLTIEPLVKRVTVTFHD